MICALKNTRSRAENEAVLPRESQLLLNLCCTAVKWLEQKLTQKWNNSMSLFPHPLHTYNTRHSCFCHQFQHKVESKGQDSSLPGGEDALRVPWWYRKGMGCRLKDSWLLSWYERRGVGWWPCNIWHICTTPMQQHLFCLQHESIFGVTTVHFMLSSHKMRFHLVHRQLHANGLCCKVTCTPEPAVTSQSWYRKSTICTLKETICAVLWGG